MLYFCLTVVNYISPPISQFAFLLLQKKAQRVFQYSQQYGTFHVPLQTIGPGRSQDSNSTVFVIAVKWIQGSQSSWRQKRPIFSGRLTQHWFVKTKQVASVRYDAMRKSCGRADSCCWKGNFLSYENGRNCTYYSPAYQIHKTLFSIKGGFYFIFLICVWCRKCFTLFLWKLWNFTKKDS